MDDYIVMTSIALCWHFLQRELRNRYLGSISGGLWALLQPLAQLAIYGFVWAYVFKQRAPGGDASPGAIVPFLAVGMWPWNAFSECMMRSTTVIQENSGLIGKVALPRPVLVIASAGASFILHGFGFIAIMLVLATFGMKIHLLMLPIALLVLLQLFLLGLGFAFLFSAVQVFVRDLSQVLGQLIPLWMFLSPVLYSRDFLPEAYRGWLSLNPFTFYPEYLRSTLLGFGEISVQTQLTAFFVAVAMCAIGYGVFLRLNPRFEDFL